MQDIEYKISNICDTKYNYFLNKKNVVGIGLGFKIKNGFNTSQKCIKVLVSHKLSINKLNKNDLVPGVFQGIITDIVKTGYMKVSSFANKIRPVPGGYSIGPGSRLPISTGTLGCIVTDNTNFYVLSCNHSIAFENTIPLGTGITQPSTKDNGNPKTDTIATLYKYIPLNFITPSHSPENYSDCAIAKISDISQVSSKLAILGNIRGISTPILEEYVEKVGRTTELTRGQITTIGATIRASLSRGQCIFKNQILATKMSDVGDSGALLVNLTNYGLGLLGGSSETSSFFTPIKSILESLNVDIVFKK